MTKKAERYEAHTNLIVVSDTPQKARLRPKSMPLFKERRMHVDDVQEIVAVDGFKVMLVGNDSLAEPTQSIVHTFRDLAPPAFPERSA